MKQIEKFWEGESPILRKFNQYKIQQTFFETLILALHCYCGDNVKYGQEHDGWKRLPKNDKHL